HVTNVPPSQGSTVGWNLTTGASDVLFNTGSPWGNFFNVSSTNVGNGWWFLQATITMPAGLTSANYDLVLYTGGIYGPYTGDGSSNVEIWNPLLALASGGSNLLDPKLDDPFWVGSTINGTTSTSSAAQPVPDASVPAAGDQVQLFNGTSALGSAIVLTSGNISNGFVDVTPAALAQGTYNFNAKITDVAGNTSGASSNYTVTIVGADTTPPTVSSVVASGAGITNGNGNLNAGKVVTLTVAFSEAVTVNTSGGTPTLALNDGGAATYTSGSGSNSLIF